jgi:hypothetical protein
MVASDVAEQTQTARVRRREAGEEAVFSLAEATAV